VEALVDVVGRAWAAEILFSARRLSAVEAGQIGLVNHVVSVDQLRPTVMDLATRITENAPLTIQACKVALGQTRLASAERDMPRLTEMIAACYRSEDYREGQAAFLEKRRPRFLGR
jgi:enoyl-CoA hydratase/carnithine racemase